MKKFDYSLMAPGPVNLHPEVRKILSEPMIHHRTPEFDKILAQVLKKMKFIFQTQEPTYLLTSTGSGGMEALLVNTLSPGDSVLCIVSGKFGERWSQMASSFGLKTDELLIPWGEAFRTSSIKEKLSQKKYAAVLTQACETSTGVLHPIQGLGELISEHPDTLLLVDGITALGALPLPLDEWHIDGLVGGSQKAFMLPTGMSFVAFSKKAQKRFDTAKIPRFYFDIRKEKKANETGETFFSSNVSLIKALNFVLTEIEKKGLTTQFNENKRRSEFTLYMIQLLGLKSYAQTPSPSLTAMCLPPGIDGQQVRAELEKDFQITVMGGQDQAKGKILRIGHMGYIQDHELLNLSEALYEVLSKHHYKAPFDQKLYSNKLNQWLKEN